MQIEEEIVADLASSGYHPRTSRHSDRQSYAIVEDLLDNCPILRERARNGEIVAKLRHHHQVGPDDWVIDLAIGTCAGKPETPQSSRINFTEPALIQIAIELKVDLYGAWQSSPKSPARLQRVSRLCASVQSENHSSRILGGECSAIFLLTPAATGRHHRTRRSRPQHNKARNRMCGPGSNHSSKKFGVRSAWFRGNRGRRD